MSNPTSNFGWQMPTATDLVTDLPADFEVFGQAVDTDFIDLLGGTTGQILSKTSATDLDFTWINNDQGDITGVTAGVGMTVANPTGPVPTVTNDMATTITAAGDIVVGTGSGTYDNLPIGTTAQVLTADTTVSPYKVKWATPSSGSMTLLSTTSLTGASVTLSSISQSHKNLYFVFVNPKTANNGIPFNIRFNADATANRHAQTDSWVSSASYSSTSAWLNQGNFGNVTDSGLLAGWIYDYTNTTTWKFGNTLGVGTDSTAGTAARFAFNMMAYNQTGAITSLLFLPNSGNWTSGTLLLYGVS